MRNVCAAILLLACLKLWIGTSGDLLSPSKAYSPSPAPALKGSILTAGAEEWMNTVEAVLDGNSAVVRASAARLYNRIMEEVRHEDYEAGAAGFRLFLELHDRSPLAAQAAYWLGECEYRLGRYQEAIASFDRALSRSPLDAGLAASAFLRKGDSYAKLGEINRSRHLLELVVAQFPDTKEAMLARKTLTLP
ncbi:MAG: hypothetical protein C4293_01080, partial [Nitrospiraceae bacterium]